MTTWSLLPRILCLFLLFRFVPARISMKLDHLDNTYPPNSPLIPDITGPFTVTVVARFDNIPGGSYQRLFDFGNGPLANNILLGQIRDTTRIRFKAWINDGNGTACQLDTDSGAITPGTTDTWEASIDATGFMTIKKNGAELKRGPGIVPNPVIRSQKLIGKSHWSSDDDLIGAVLGLKVVNHNDAQDFRSLGLWNLPSQILGGNFVASFYARFDSLSTDRSDQKIFEIGNGVQDTVSFGQLSNTSSVVFEVKQHGAVHECIFTGGTEGPPLIQGQMALWRLQVMFAGEYSIFRIEKNGTLLKECTMGGSAAPISVFRLNLLIGESNSAGVSKMQGVILGLRIDDAY